MTKTILVKKNGEVFEKEAKRYISNKAYLTEEESCFKDLVNEEIILKMDQKKISEIKEQVKYVINEITKTDISIINSVAENLKNIKTKQDLINMLDILIKAYFCSIESNKNNNWNLTIITKLRENIKNNYDTVISITIKRIVSVYYKNKISKLSPKEISELQIMISKKPEKIFEYLNETYDMNAINNGLYNLSQKMIMHYVDKMEKQNSQHLCWDCKNCSPLTCEKIFHTKKQTIDKYSFIIDGYQEIENKDIKVFVISKCNNFKK